MHSTGVFFGGLAVGGILAAACGFDLFPGGRGDGRASEAARTELKEARSALARAAESARRAEARSVELEAKLAAARDRQGLDAGLEKVIASRSAEADFLRSEAAHLGAELRAAREAAQAAQSENRRLRRDVLHHILDYFARERSPAEAGLVTRYLATDASKEEQHALVLELLKRNREAMLARPQAEGDPAVAIEPAAAREPGGLGGVVPAVDAADALDPASGPPEGR